MKFKQLLISVIITCLIIIPKELFFKPENFWVNMGVNIVGFMIGGVVGGLLFMKKKEEAVPEKKETREFVPIAPLPEATKAEDYDKYMPK